jgi:hypothetical protein
VNLTGPLSLRFPIVVVVPAPGPVNAVSDPVPRPLRLPSVVPVNHETVTVESLGPPGEEPGKPATVVVPFGSVLGRPTQKIKLQVFPTVNGIFVVCCKPPDPDKPEGASAAFVPSGTMRPPDNPSAPAVY